MSNELTTKRCNGICGRCDGAGTILDWSSGRLPCPECRPMIDSEATTAGAIRQSLASGEETKAGRVLPSTDGVERSGPYCPWCGAPKSGFQPYSDMTVPETGQRLAVTKYDCGSVVDGKDGGYQGDPCVRKQLRQAKGQLRDYRVFLTSLERQLAEALGRERAAVTHNFQLQQALERVEWVKPPEDHGDLGRWCPTCRAWEAYGHDTKFPFYGGKVNGILAGAPSNPYAAVMEAAIEWREARKACVDSPPKSKIFREVRDASLRAEVELEKAVDALSGGQAR